VTRALALKQKQITALCKGAEKAGYVPVVEIDGARVLLVPDNHAILRLVEAGKVDEIEDNSF
jgi:hypothetical protein